MVAMKDVLDLGEKIAQKFQPERIILYGSHARGNASDNSDVDLMVILPLKGHSIHMALEIRKRVHQEFPLDLLVRTPQEFEQRLRDEDWFIREVLAQGKVLYEAPHDRVD